ncbi:MAG: endonuclease [Chloroflexaceae bacterium]|nr:endonuclease [Chloroflexaceae bacterium]
MPVSADALPDDAGKKKEYDQVIMRVFTQLQSAEPQADRLSFTKADIERAVSELGLNVRNVPDIAYTYRTGRSPLPAGILAYGNWAIDGAGKSKYIFVKLTRSPYVDIPTDIEIVRVLDATPQIVLKYQSRDEQALLARIRYNRLIDTFTGLTAYHLQGHFRTTVKNVGQVEIDDLYIGIDTDGNSFILPLEAKSAAPKDKLGVVQITSMVKFSRQYFPELAMRPIGVKVLGDDSYLFMEFNDSSYIK